MVGAADPGVNVRESAVESAVRSLLVCYDRLDLLWRRRFDLSPKDKVVMLHLAEHSTATPSELCRVLGMSSAGMTNLLDRLQEKQLIYRHPHAGDARRVLVSLTKRGVVAQLELKDLHSELARVVERDRDGADADVVELLGAAQDAINRRILALEA